MVTYLICAFASALLLGAMCVICVKAGARAYERGVEAGARLQGRETPVAPPRPAKPVKRKFSNPENVPLSTS